MVQFPALCHMDVQVLLIPVRLKVPVFLYSSGVLCSSSYYVGISHRGSTRSRTSFFIFFGQVQVWLSLCPRFHTQILETSKATLTFFCKCAF